MSQYKPYPAYKDSGVEWLGRVPEGWEVSRMKNSIAFAQNGVWGDDPDGGADDIGCARVADFDRENCTVSGELPTQRKIAPEQRKFRIVNPGDLLLEKSGGGEQTSVGAVVQYVGSSPVVCSNFVAVVKCGANASSRWLCYVNAHLYSVGVNRRSIKQTTGIQNIDSDEYLSESIAVPSQTEQRVIAAHLDRETVRLDGLVAKKTRFIELLREKRQALITHAVTKGLDPTVKMKNSNVEWLGQVPEHWVVCCIQHVINGIEQGWSPECLSTPADDDQWGVVKSGCVNGGVFNGNDNKTLPQELTPMPQYEIRAGDVLMSRASGSPELIGSVALVSSTRNKLMLSDKVFRIACSKNMLAAFFVRVMGSRMMRTQIELSISGADGLANNLPQSRIKKLMLVRPPVGEQAEICNYIDRQTTRLDTLIEKTERSIALIKERRAALITAAVTGQIDLRAA